MKYVYIVLIVALIGGGYYVFSSHQQSVKEAASIPDGYHKMPDGTLVKNDVMQDNAPSVPQTSAAATMQASGTMMMQEGTKTEEQSEDSNGTQENIASQAISQSGNSTVVANSKAKVFEIHASNYKFDVTQIHVNKGDTVTIHFQSDNGLHDWAIDEFNASTQKVQPGTLTSVTFVADKVGTFEYYCSVGQHRAMGMVGKLIVEG